MPVRLLHLSDLHLNGSSTPDEGVDADRSLALVLEACAPVEGVAAVVVTGDVADDGSEAAYQRARSALLDFAGARGAQLVMSTGNHDDRDAFTTVLGAGHFSPNGERVGEPGPDGWVCASSIVGGLRIVTLDSLVPGMWFGRLGIRQLSWLQGLFETDPTTPTILAFHHPPLDLGVEIQQRVGLEDRDPLASTIRAGAVAAILCGHFHQQVAGSLGGITIWVTSAVLNRIEHLSVPPGHERAVTGGSATVVDFTDPTAPLFATITARDPEAGREIYTVTTNEIADSLDSFGLPSVTP